MSSFRKTLWILSVAFFAIGIYWGVHSGSPSFLMALFSSKTPPLTFVCSEDWLPKATADKIESELGIEIEWQNYSNWSELSRILGNHQGRFDLLCVHSFLSKDLTHSGWMDEFDYKSLPEIKNLASDFRQMPFDPQGLFFVPIGWMINGYLTESGRGTLSWDQIWPSQASQLVMNHPDLELYWRMRQEGLEIDVEKQGRYNQDPQGFVKKFMTQLGGIKHPNENALNALKTSKIVQASNKVWLNQSHEFKEKFKLSEMTDGMGVWFLAVGVGKHSTQKIAARKVISELLSPSISNDLRIQRGFAHVLGQFNDSKEIPAEMKASFIRSFPLRSLKFPDLSLEGLPQWETMMKDETRSQAPDKPN